MTPTRIYVKSLLKTIRETGAIKGLAHITGGGFPENIPRVLPKTLAAEIDLDQVPVTELFAWLAKEGGVAPEEMLRTFNCGIGMIVVVAEDKAAQVIQSLTEADEIVVPLGRLRARSSDGAGVIYKGKLGL